MAEVIIKEWSLSTPSGSTTQVATLTEVTKDDGVTTSSRVLCTISGLPASGINADEFNAADAVTYEGSDSPKTITLSKTLLEKITTDNTVLTLDAGSGDYGYPTYRLKLGDGVSDQTTIDKTTAFTIDTPNSDGDANIKAKLTAYYELGSGGHTVTYHAAKENQTIATLHGVTGTITAPTAGQTAIALTPSNLIGTTTTSSGTTTAGKGVTYEAATIANLDTTTTGNIDPANITFTLSSSDQDVPLGNDSKTLGFKDDGNEYAKVADDSTAVTYNSKAKEGWTLASDSKSISYTGASSTPLIMIKGFKSEVSIAAAAGTDYAIGDVTLNNEGTQKAVESATNSGKTTFKIYTKALGEEDLELVHADGTALTDDDKSKFALALNRDNNTAAGAPTDNNKVGFGNETTKASYWTVKDGLATYQYDVAEGWTLDTTTNKITHTDAANTQLIKLSGLKATDTTDKNTTTLTGVTFGSGSTEAGAKNAAADTIYLKSDVFDLTKDTSTVTFAQTGEVGDNTYTKIALDENETNQNTELKLKETNDLKLSGTFSGGNTEITGDTEVYYTSSGDTALTSHKAQDDVVVAEISGLAEAASSSNVTFDAATKTLTLTDDALGTDTVTLTVKTAINGVTINDLEPSGEEFTIALDLTTKKKEANQVDTTARKSITLTADSDNKKATITGATLPYYTLESTNKKSVTYTAAGTATLATITGLKSDATDQNGAVSFKMDGTTQTGTIVLSKDALGSTEIVLTPASLGGIGALGLQLAFDEDLLTDSTKTDKTKAGFGDSGNYWTLDASVATNGTIRYQHNVKEGWELTAGLVVTHKEAKDPETIFTLNNLKFTSATPTPDTDNVLVDGESARWSKLKGITVDSTNKTVTISKELLQADAVDADDDKAVTLPTGTDYTFKIIDTKAGAVAGTSVGFDKHTTEPYWRIDGTTAYLQYDIDEGWEIKNGKIVYTGNKTGEKGITLATITGLKSGLTGTEHKFPDENTIVDSCYDTIAGLTVENGVIKIGSSALATLSDNATIELTNATGSNYTLALDASLKDITDDPAKIAIDFTAGSSSSPSSATVKRTRDAGWEVSENNTKLTYKTEVDDTLASIDKLSGDIVEYTDGGKTKYGVSIGGGNYKEVLILDGKTIKLKNDALPQENITLTRGSIVEGKVTADDVAYSLQLIDDNGTQDADGKFGFENADAAEKYWHVDSTTPTTAHYQYDVGEGWTLAANGLSVGYTKAKREQLTSETDEDYAKVAEAPTKLATITGLRKADSSADPAIEAITDEELNTAGIITVAKNASGFNVVTLDTSILNTTDDNNDGIGDTPVHIDKTTYKLAIKGATNGEYGFENKDLSSKYFTFTTADDGTITATYQYDVGAGWKVNETNDIVYSPPQHKELFKITGLKSGFMTIDESKHYTTVEGITVEPDGTIKLAEKVLNTIVAKEAEGDNPAVTAVNVSLTDSDINDLYTYKLAFDADASEITTNSESGIKTLGCEDNTPSWEVATENSVEVANYQYTTKQGWNLNPTTNTIEYVPATTDTNATVLVKVTGLTDDGSLKANLNSGAITVSSKNTTEQNPGKLTLSSSVLAYDNDTDVKIISGGTGHYTLAISNEDDLIAKDERAATIGLDFNDSEYGVSVVKVTPGGWYYEDDNKQELKCQVGDYQRLVVFDGFKANLTKDDISLGTGSTEEEKKIYVSKSALQKGSSVALTNQTINGVKQTYKFELKDANETNFTGKDNLQNEIENAPAFGFEEGDKYFAVDTTEDTTVNYQHDVGDGWFLNTSNDSIYYVYPRARVPEGGDYTKYKDPIVDAKITGLKSDLTDAEIASGIVLGQDKKTITVSKDVFGTASTIALKKYNAAGNEIAMPTSEYTLALKDADKDGKVGFENEDGAKTYWKITGNDGNYTATYMYHVEDGWTISGNTITATFEHDVAVIEVSGLKTATGTARKDADGNTIAGEFDTLTGVSVVKNGTTAADVKLAKSVLGENEIEISEVDENGNVSGKDDSAFKDVTYSLAFDGDTTTEGTQVKFGFDDKDPYWKVDGTTAKYQYDIDEGWTYIKDTTAVTDYNTKYNLTGDNALKNTDVGKIVYTKASDDTSADGTKSTAVTLAQITNLKSNLVADEGKIDGITLGTDKKTITVSKDVLSDATATLLDGNDKAFENGEYKLALVASETVKDSGNKKIGFADGDPYWTVGTGANAGEVYYQYDTEKGWTLKDDGSEITYSKPHSTTSGDDDPTVLATISGLAESDISAPNGVIDGIDVDANGVITLSKTSLFKKPTGANTSTEVSLTLNPKLTSGTYKLAVDTDVINTEKHVDVDTTDDNKKIKVTYNDDGTATVSGTIEEYVTANSNGTQLTYYKEKTGETLATVSGLSNSSTNGVSYNNGTITITNAAIGTITTGSTVTNPVIKLIRAKNTNGTEIADNPDYLINLDSSVSQTANVTSGAKSIKSVSNGTATIQQATEAYYAVSQDGQSVSYNASTNKVIAEITGLDKSATTSNVTLIPPTAPATDTTITLKKAALGKGTMALVNKKVGSTSDHGLELAFDTSENTTNIPVTATKVGGKETAVEQGNWVVKNDVATYSLTTSEGWVIDSVTNTISYTPETTKDLAVVKGLNGLKNGTYDYNGITGLTVTAGTADATTKIIPITVSVAENLLDKANVTVTDLDADDKKDFALKLTKDSNTAATELGFDGASTKTLYWVVKDGTATYQYDVGAGWTVAADGSISYTPATSKVILTVEGLRGIANGTYKTTTAISDLKAAGLSVKSVTAGTDPIVTYTVSLNNNVLGYSNIKLTKGDGADLTDVCKFALPQDNGTASGDNGTADDGIIGGVEATAAWFVDSDGVAKYQKNTGAKWQLAAGDNPTTITYTPAKEYDGATTLVTIEGLKKGVTAEDLATFIDVDDTSATKTVTLHKDILGTTDVNFTSAKNAAGTAAEYTLKLGGDVPASTTKEYWTLSGTKGTYKQDRTEGWELNGNTVSYTEAKTGIATLATLNGLKKGIELLNTDDVDKPNTIEGISVSGSKILVSDAALAAGALTLTQGKDANGDTTAYALVYNGAHAKPTTITASAGWLVGGGVATLKELNPLYYEATKSGKNSTTNDKIAYTAATAPSTGATVYAVLKGISKSATVNDLEGAFSGLELNADKTVKTKGVITVPAEILNRANVTINNNNYYTLAVDENKVAKPEVTKSAWKLNKTTATMTGDMSEGYRASGDGKTIVYSKPQTNATLLTISGLPANGIAYKNNMIYVTDSNGTQQEAFTITNGKVTMNEAVLAKAPAKITLKGTGYEFADLTSFDTSGDSNYTASEYDSNNVYIETDEIVAGKKKADGTYEKEPGVMVWRVSGTTATLKKVIPAHYKLTSSNTLVYVKETDAKNSSKQAIVYATITGLAKGLKVSADGQKVLTADNQDAIVFGTGNDATKFDIKEAALSTSQVKWTLGNTSGYTLNLPTASNNATTGAYLVDNASKEINNIWLAGGTVATLRSKGTTEGWLKAEVKDKNGNITAYTFTKQTTAKATSDSTVLARIDGLKKGITANGDGTVNGITLANTNITLDNRVLPVTGTANKTVVKLGVNNGSYKLGIDTTANNEYAVAEKDKEVAGKVWSVSGANVTIKDSTKATWTLDSATGNLVFQDKETTTNSGAVTISGLKKGLKLNANGKVDGIEVSADGKTFTLDSRVLGTTTVSVTAGYTLALADAGKYTVSAPTTTPTWSVSGTKAILKNVTKAGWTYNSDTNKILYTPAKTSAALATINGIKSGLKAENGSIEGIVAVKSSDALAANGTFYLSASVLDSKTVKLTSSGDYKDYNLKLATADASSLTTTQDGSSVWTFSGTTATLKSAITKGYTENGKELTYNDGTKAGSNILATITGLKKGLRVVNGGITGITVGDPVTTGTGAEATTSRTITLDSRVLGTTNATLTDTADSVTYTLALQTDPTKSYAVVDATAGFKYSVDKNGIVTVSSGYTPKGYHLDGSTIEYNKSATTGTLTNVATIKGLKSGIKADANGQIAGITSSGAGTADSKYIFTLSKDVLGTTDIEVTGSHCGLDLGTDVTNELSSAATPTWAAGEGNTAVMTIKSDGGYFVTTGKDKITYTPKGTTKVVVNGVSSVTGLSADSVDLNTKTITIPTGLISGLTAGTSVTVSDGYTLALDAGSQPATEWVVKGTTASLVQTATANGYLCDGTKITKVGANGGSQVLATITGLPEGFKAYTNDTPPAAKITINNGVIKLPADAFTDNKSTIQLTGAGYTLDNTSNAVSDIETGTWFVTDVAATNTIPASTTATYATGGETGYYKFSTDGKRATYQPFKATGSTFEVKGLAAGVKASTLNATSGWYSSTDKKITLTKDLLGDTDVTVGTGYKLELDSAVPTKAADVAADAKNTWTLTGTTLKINTTAGDYYEETSNTKITHKGGNTTLLAQISGLPKGTTLNAAGTLDGITLDDVNKTIKVSTSEIIGTGAISIASGSAYTFVLSNEVSVPTTTEYVWSISGTTATLKKNVSEGYTLSADGKKISYTKEATPAIATLTGLKKGLTAENGEISGIAFDEKTGVVTVSEEALDTTKVTLNMGNGVAAGTYTLDLDTESVVDVDDAEVINGTNVWTYDAKNVKAIYKKVTPAHYKLNGNSIEYVAQKDVTGGGLATLTGATNFDAETMFDGDKTVNISANNLNSKPVNITGGDYEIELDSQVSNPGVSDAKWTQTATTKTAVLKGTRTAGYTQKDAQNITYTAPQTNQVFASIVGATGTFQDSDYVNLEEEKVYLYASELDDSENKAVTVSGGFLLDFNGYNEASIIGSTGADSIAVDGTKLTIAAGSGNDYIDLGLQGGNKVIYGGGNDVIADFDATGTNQDVLQLSTGSITKAVYDDGDAILTVGTTGKITLKDFNADSITYLDNKGNATTRAIVSADLLDSDNFLGADSELGSIVSDTDKLGDLEDTKALTNSDVTTLTKQSSLITYGKK